MNGIRGLLLFVATKEPPPGCTQEVVPPGGPGDAGVGEATQPSTPPAGALEAGVAGGVGVQVRDAGSLVQLGALQPHLVQVEPAQGIKQESLAGSDILHQ